MSCPMALSWSVHVSGLYFLLKKIVSKERQEDKILKNSLVVVMGEGIKGIRVFKIRETGL